ncbi:hypothetical protein MSTE_03555 [Mycobacteroides stephanolepidis]|uniref:Tail assembly chaperone n=1 Tax=[Mycobacterium] stephanolepidis TaxID=1520670 RepID=A0A1Z4F0U4_9MYCO|nr:hypothetical protein [[Mycobacterium] stephanolepidis]BAX98855.1 hypothetical protein MSTE_03555 [[Mycobacterium] stephanolepidis]
MANTNRRGANTTPEDDAASTTDEPDLDKATVELKWAGLTFTIPKRRGRWPVSALRDFARGRNYEAVVTLIGGEKPWQKLAEKCPTGDAFDEFLDYVRGVIEKECVL